MRAQPRSRRLHLALAAHLRIADAGEHIAQRIVHCHDPPSYQLDFTRPGINPFEPYSRTVMRAIFILRRKPGGRPLISQRWRIREAAELRGSSASFSRAAKRSSMVRASLLAIAFNRRRRPAYCLTSLMRW